MPGTTQLYDKYGLLSAPIRSVLTRMTLPMILGIISVQLFNLVDTFFISLLGTQALAAISFTFPVTFVVLSLIMGLGVGLSTHLAHLLGQGAHERAAAVTTHGLVLTVLLVALAGGLGYLAIDPLFTLLGAEAALLPLIKQYMQIWYAAIPLLAIPMAGNAAIRATGDTRTPSLVMITAGVVNGLLDPLLIFGIGPFPAMGVAGAAIASAGSWLLALVVALRILVVRERLLSPMLLKLRRMRRYGRTILAVGLPAAFTNMLTPLANGLLMALLARQGTEAVAAFGAGNRIEVFLLLVVMGLSSSLAPFVSQNNGAGQPLRVRRALLGSYHFSLVFQLALYLLVVWFSPWLVQAFTQDPEVDQLLNHYLQILPLSYGALGIVMLTASTLNALHRPLQSMLLSLTRLFVILLPSAWIGVQIAGPQGIFVAMTLSNLLVAGIIYRHVWRQWRVPR